MTEDEISEEMYLASHEAKEVMVLTWQGVGGKSYFYRDLRLLLGDGRRQKPDLVLLAGEALWIIEIKGTHTESRADDEPKLSQLRAALTDREIRRQVSQCARVGIDPNAGVRLAVAYSDGVPGANCVEGIVHLPWLPWRPDMLGLLTSV